MFAARLEHFSRRLDERLAMLDQRLTGFEMTLAAGKANPGTAAESAFWEAVGTPSERFRASARGGGSATAVCETGLSPSEKFKGSRTLDLSLTQAASPGKRRPQLALPRERMKNTQSSVSAVQGQQRRFSSDAVLCSSSLPEASRVVTAPAELEQPLPAADAAPTATATASASASVPSSALLPSAGNLADDLSQCSPAILEQPLVLEVRGPLQPHALKSHSSRGRELGSMCVPSWHQSGQDVLAAGSGESHRWILRPSSTKRLVWDICGVFLIMYDMIFIPIQLAFEPSPSVFTWIMFIMALIFWTADFILAFFTGFYHKGSEELRPGKILRHYLLGWCFFDLVVVCSDWVTFLSERSRIAALGRMAKSMRIVRVVRSMRLLRLVKLQRIAETFLDHIDSEHILIMIGMAKGTVVVVGMNHVIACVWFGLSRLVATYSPGDLAWVTKAGFLEGEETLINKYLTSLHWSLTQFTPASMEVVPCNVYERAMAVTVLIFALLVFSSFLSTITSCMTQLRQLAWTYDKNLSLLRKFLHLNQISSGLSVRIVKYVEHRLWVKRTETREADVPLLNILSSQLNMELVHELREPVLTVHPFFKRLAHICPAVMMEVCHKAVTTLQFVRGDSVFVDLKTEGMMFVVKGVLEYIQANDLALEGTIVNGGSWLCEQALWATGWEFAGELFAREPSDLLLVNSAKFIEQVLKTVPSRKSASMYAVSLVKKLSDMPRHECDQISDVACLPSSELEGLAAAAWAEYEERATPSLFQRVMTRVDMGLGDDSRACEADALPSHISESIPSEAFATEDPSVPGVVVQEESRPLAVLPDPAA